MKFDITERATTMIDPIEGVELIDSPMYNKGCKKKCFICNKEGCWSTKHTAEERI
jgi:hypothetical protein